VSFDLESTLHFGNGNISNFVLKGKNIGILFTQNLTLDASCVDMEEGFARGNYISCSPRDVGTFEIRRAINL
jgi:hypothetical protein